MIDLLVVGGGPVGLATALFGHRAGLSVEVAEPRAAPIDKACGEGLMPGAVGALRELGLTLPGRRFRGIRYTNGRQSAEATFDTGVGLGVRRTALQAALLDAVHARGIRVHQRSVGAIEQDDRGVYGDGLAARYLAAADGLHSGIRRQVGLDLPTRGAARYGLRSHFTVAAWTDLVEVHWAHGREAYVTPVGDDLVSVAVLTTQRAPFEEQLRSFPSLLPRLPLGQATDTRGAGPLRQRCRARHTGRVFLVGDAAGYVDALTGEGIAVGLACAQGLVECIIAGRPQHYERLWLRSSRRYRCLTESLLWARNRPLLAPAIVPTAARLPALFTAAVHQLAH